MSSGVVRKQHVSYINRFDGFKAEHQRNESFKQCTQIKVNIRWCNTSIQWLVVAPWPGIGLAPDVVCHDEDFRPLAADGKSRSSFCQTLEDMLLHWNPDETSCLHRLIQTLLDGFRDHQLAKLSQIQNDRLQFELSTLPHTPGLEAMYLLNGRQACFGIPLDALELSKLLPLLPYDPLTATPTQPDSSSSCAIGSFKLEVSFQVANMESPDVTLRVPQALQALLPPLQLPGWSRQSCLMEYVPLVVERVQQQLGALADTLKLRMQVVEAMREVLGHPLEVNPHKLMACWQVMWQSSPLLLFLELGPKFPEERPSITIQSLRPVGGQGNQVVVKGVPWSPRWTATEMATRIISYLKEELPAVIGALPSY